MKRIITVLAVCLALNLSLMISFADTLAPPYAYKIEIDDSKVLIMLPENVIFDGIEKSGLYINASPYENIYYFNNYFFPSEVISSDGRFWVDMPWVRQDNLGNPSWTEDDWSGDLSPYILTPAIDFYKDGYLIKSYEVWELMDDVSKSTISASHMTWADYHRQVFDSDLNILSVTALDGKTTYFDITTGLIISDSPEPVINNSGNFANKVVILWEPHSEMQPDERIKIIGENLEVTAQKPEVTAQNPKTSADGYTSVLSSFIICIIALINCFILLIIKKRRKV
ncbi:MAG: hypothetical protein FWG70_11075 [Oscillospiraceae bacterium]|nr:hypothetical protein [Oscillospiraceae bacterium]